MNVSKQRTSFYLLLIALILGSTGCLESKTQTSAGNNTTQESESQQARNPGTPHNAGNSENSSSSGSSDPGALLPDIGCDELLRQNGTQTLVEFPGGSLTVADLDDELPGGAMALIICHLSPESRKNPPVIEFGVVRKDPGKLPNPWLAKQSAIFTIVPGGSPLTAEQNTPFLLFTPGTKRSGQTAPVLQIALYFPQFDCGNTLDNQAFFLVDHIPYEDNFEYILLDILGKESCENSRMLTESIGFQDVNCDTSVMPVDQGYASIIPQYTQPDQGGTYQCALDNLPLQRGLPTEFFVTGRVSAEAFGIGENLILPTKNPDVVKIFGIHMLEDKLGAPPPPPPPF